MKKVFLLLLAGASLLKAADEATPLLSEHTTDRVSIIFPAYNEEFRIGPTLERYADFYGARADLLVVLNGCTDNTRNVVEQACAKYPSIHVMQLEKAGKGYAVAQGFLHALEQFDTDFIRFVDADGATQPEAFDELVVRSMQRDVDQVDGVIASRYMPGAQSTERPFIKEWGRRLCLLPLVNCLFDLSYQDVQCGAKIFKRHLIERVAPLMKAEGWNFDIELLYLAQREGFSVVELPTVWEDQDGSHLDSCSSGIPMLCSLCCMRLG